MKTFKKKFKTQKQIEGEVYFLKKLSSYDFFPKIVRVDKINNELEMSFCGRALEEEEEKPKSWKKQIKEIIEILERENIYHNDMHDENFLCDDDKIFLVDFGKATEGSEAFPFLNVSSSCLEKCECFDSVFLQAEKNLKKKYRL